MSDLIDHLLAKNTSVPTVIRPRPASLFEPAPDVPWMPPSQNGGPAEHVEDDAVSIARAAARTYEEPQIKRQRFPPGRKDDLPPVPLSNTAGYQEVEHTVLPPAIRGIPASHESKQHPHESQPDREENIAEITTSSVQRNIHEQPQGQLQNLPGMRISADWNEEVPIPSSSTMMPDELEETARPVAQRFQPAQEGKRNLLYNEYQVQAANSSMEAPSRLSTSPYPVQPAGSEII